MKIAYLSYSQMSDVDMSFLQTAQKTMDIHYFLFVSPHYQHGAAVSIDKLYSKTGIFSPNIYPELAKYQDIVDFEKLHILNAPGKLWAIKTFFLYFYFLFYLLRHKFNVLHLIVPLNLYEWPLYFLKKRMVLTVHDPIPHSGETSLLSNIRRRTAFKMIDDLIILNSKQRVEFIETYGLQNKKVHVSRLSVYSYLSSLTYTQKCEIIEPFILFFGRISPYKGLDILFKAMDILRQEGIDIKLVVAGSGKYYFDNSYYEQTCNIKILNRFIPEEELVALLKKCTFTVVPYIDATQSGVIMTSYAFNVPVVATNVGGLPDMVEDGKFGVIIPPSDEVCLANAIKNLWEHPELVRNFSENIACDYVHGENSWEKITKQIKEIYENINNK